MCYEMLYSFENQRTGKENTINGTANYYVKNDNARPWASLASQQIFLKRGYRNIEVLDKYTLKLWLRDLQTMSRKFLL